MVSRKEELLCLGTPMGLDYPLPVLVFSATKSRRLGPRLYKAPGKQVYKEVQVSEGENIYLEFDEFMLNCSS